MTEGEIGDSMIADGTYSEHRCSLNDRHSRGLLVVQFREGIPLHHPAIPIKIVLPPPPFFTRLRFTFAHTLCMFSRSSHLTGGRILLSLAYTCCHMEMRAHTAPKCARSRRGHLVILGLGKPCLLPLQKDNEVAARATHA